jgi:hypothetical protein
MAATPSIKRSPTSRLEADQAANHRNERMLQLRQPLSCGLRPGGPSSASLPVTSLSPSTNIRSGYASK